MPFIPWEARGRRRLLAHVVRGAVWPTLLTSGRESGIAGRSLSRAPFPSFTAEAQSFILRSPRTKWKESTAFYPCPLSPWHCAAKTLWEWHKGGSKDNLTEHKERRQGTRECWFCSHLHDWLTNQSCKSHSTSPGFRFFSLPHTRQMKDSVIYMVTGVPRLWLFYFCLCQYSAQSLTQASNKTFCTIIKSTCIKIYNIVYFYWKSLIAS